MTVEFVELTGQPGSAAGEAHVFALTRIMAGDPVEAMMQAFGEGLVVARDEEGATIRIFARVEAFDGDAGQPRGSGIVFGFDEGIMPNIGVLNAEGIGEVEVGGYSIEFGGLFMFPTGEVFAGDPPAAGAIGQTIALPPYVYGTDSLTNFDNSGFLVQSPGFLYGTMGYEKIVVGETFGIEHAQDMRSIWVLSSTLGIGAPVTTLLETFASVTDDVGMTDALGVLYRMLLSDAIGAGDAPEASALFGAQLAESLALLSGAGTSLEAINRVAQALAFGDTLAVLAREQLSDQAAFNAAYGQALTARNRQLDQIAFEATPVGSATIGMLVDESIATNDTALSVAELRNVINEQLAVSITFRLGDSVYAAWVCNTAIKAFSQYENYPFNSFFEMPKGVWHGVADHGVFTLDGPDDDGDAIRARIRSGLYNVGSGKIKQIPSMYLAYRANGRMVLKVITTSTVDGEKTENWYLLRPADGNACVREGRVKIGRGLKSVFYGFELENVDGADFSAESLELMPLLLDRRIDGGSTS